MRKNQLLSVLSLFLLVPASITRAQTATLTGTVSIEQDYRVVNFNSPKGNVKIFLPGNLSGPGQGTVLLSGTVMAEPAGKTEKEKVSNLKALQKMLLSIGGKSISILPGQNHFNFSLPTNLTTPIDLIDPGGNRATVSLKNLVVSPPPSTGTLLWGQSPLSTDQKIFLTNGNIPVYAANNTSTLFQPTDKFFIKYASGNMTEASKVAQCPTQTVLSSQGLQPGATTIVRQSGNRTDQVNVRMANLTLSSPNTDLRKGHTSFFTVTADPKIADKDSANARQIPIIQFDIRNLSSGVIDMAGGNLQVMTFPTKPNSIDPANWQVTRTITGVTPGNFNVIASLYPSTSITNSPAITQQKALTNCAQYNTWLNAVKKQLEHFITVDANNDSKDYARFVISSLPACTIEDDLDLNKMATTNLLRDIQSSANLETGLPSLAAYQAASFNLANPATLVFDFVHTDIIQNGLKIIENASRSLNDTALTQSINVAKNAAVALNNDYSSQNISTLTTSLNGLNTTAFVSNLVTSSLYSIGWSFSCEECTKICDQLKTDCVPGKQFKGEPIEGKSFKDKSGRRWQKKRLYQRECREEQCYNLWGDLCCAYKILTDWEYVEGWDFWEVGETNASGGITWVQPQPGSYMPCNCGTLFDILQRVYAKSILEGLSWEERVSKLESQFNLYCPGLTLGSLPGMANNCGFPGADKELTNVSKEDLIKWVEGILEGMFHELHGK
jgi:hypothetical protein